MNCKHVPYAVLIQNKMIPRVYDELEKSLTVYKTLLESQRKLYNLIGHREDIEEHLADSLAPAHVFLDTAQHLYTKHGNEFCVRCVDLGTGAGLPGIPLAIFFAYHLNASYQWLLLERTQKKAHFVQSAVYEIERALCINLHIKVICQNLREWKPEGEIHIVTARAFSTLNHSLLTLIKTKAPHAQLLLYKGLRTKLNEELQWLSTILCVEDIVKLKHPAGKERHMLVAKFNARKIHHTSISH